MAVSSGCHVIFIRLIFFAYSYLAPEQQLRMEAFVSQNKSMVEMI
jgi:hypothetical protein